VRQLKGVHTVLVQDDDERGDCGEQCGQLPVDVRKEARKERTLTGPFYVGFSECGEVKGHEVASVLRVCSASRQDHPVRFVYKCPR
jgi:hypothetical protein